MRSLPDRFCLKESGAKVEHLGLLHSHPQWYGNKRDNDQYSWGDSLVSVLSGKIYLTTPHGEVYALEREDGKELIWPGMKRERMVKKGKKLGTDEGDRGRWPVSVWSAWADGGLIDQQDERSKGSNFTKFAVKTYDTRR